jgi:hypothetical protein
MNTCKVRRSNHQYNAWSTATGNLVCILAITTSENKHGTTVQDKIKLDATLQQIDIL